MTLAPVWWTLGGAMGGLIFGSFIATLVIRWPQERTMSGRSACDRCGRTLAMPDLMPLFSWAIMRGRCRTCGARIDWRHPAIELVSALIGGVAMSVQPGVMGFAGAAFGWQLLALAALDAEHFWLPNRLTILLAISGLGAAVSTGDIQSRLVGGAIGFAALFAIARLYRRVRARDGMGGGDPKLLGAIGCWLGWQALPLVLIGASLLGIVVALLLLARGKAVAATTRLPLGTLMAVTAFPLWILSQR